MPNLAFSQPNSNHCCPPPLQVNASSYTNRPEWQSLEDITGKSMKQTSRLEKHIRNAQVCRRDSAVETGCKGAF